MHQSHFSIHESTRAKANNQRGTLKGSTLGEYFTHTHTHRGLNDGCFVSRVPPPSSLNNAAHPHPGWCGVRSQQRQPIVIATELQRECSFPTLLIIPVALTNVSVAPPLYVPVHGLLYFSIPEHLPAVGLSPTHKQTWPIFKPSVHRSTCRRRRPGQRDVSCPTCAGRPPYRPGAEGFRRMGYQLNIGKKRTEEKKKKQQAPKLLQFLPQHRRGSVMRGKIFTTQSLRRHSNAALWRGRGAKNYATAAAHTHTHSHSGQCPVGLSGRKKGPLNFKSNYPTPTYELGRPVSSGVELGRSAKMV